MSSSREGKLGTFSTLSIGIGGMVGGGIFAVTGLTVDVTKGAAPIAFLIAGFVALLTSYSYLKLTLRFPGEGDTVEFLNRALGPGIVTGAANILLLLSYVVLLAINATFYGAGRLAYIIARTGELPKTLERTMHGQHLEGTLITALFALVIANFVPLEAIATMGSAGFLLLFMAANIANVRLAHDTGGRAWISAVAALSTAVALIVLCVKVDENPATRNHLWILLGMILGSFGIEIVYRNFTGREIHLARLANEGGAGTTTP